MKQDRILDLLPSFPKLLQLVTACTLVTLSLWAQERPLLLHEMEMPGRDIVDVEEPRVGKLGLDELGLPGRMRRDYPGGPSHRNAPSLSVPRSSFPSGLNQYPQPIASSLDSVAEDWVARYNGPGNGDDYANALAVDGNGSVYVTGSSYSGTSGDYATIKYDASGVQQWVARYNGPGSGGGYAIALTVDASGNVYVTGSSTGSGTSSDYATIKYDTSGVEQWVARYNGPGNSIDYATALAVDADGNVYVTGYSTGSGTGSDYATIKYDASGVEQWVARYNGLGNSVDYANALAVDGSGNVYVTGPSVGSSASYDYATIKYDASGVEQWVARYNGMGNSDDSASALALDASGNVYVTGYTDSNTAGDYGTIKYDPSGVEQWVARYNGLGDGFDDARALAVDGSGNVYVTGFSAGSTSYNYTTIKYDASGGEQWVAHYNGPGDGDDYATALAVDGSRGVYVTGSSYSGTSDDCATIKYDASGVEQWVARYNGPGNYYDYATALAVDAIGNVFVTGYSAGSGTSFDYATIKYTTGSDPLAQYGVSYGSTGSSEPNNPGALISVDPLTGAGSLIGATGIIGDDGPAVRALAIKSTGEMYALSYTASSDLYAVNASSGAATFVANTGLLHPGDMVFDANNVLYAVDETNILYTVDPVTGARTVVGGTGVTLGGLAYDPTDGKVYGSDNNDGIYTINLTTGAATLVGTTGLGGNTPDILFDQAGNLFGVKSGTGGISNYISIDKTTASGIVIGSTGFVAVVGLASRVLSTPTIPCTDITSMAARCIGGGVKTIQVRVNLLNSTIHAGEEITIAIDESQYTSTIITNGTHSRANFSVPGWSLGDHAVSLVDPPGCLADKHANCVAGDGIAKADPYWDDDAEWMGTAQEVPQATELLGNYPNPFNPSSNIQYALSEDAHVTLRVYNMLGQLVATLVDESEAAGYKTVVWYGRNDAGGNVASGIYIYRMSVVPTARRDLVPQEGDGTAGAFTATKRMLLLK